MTTFARPSLLDHRYADIAETSVFTYDDDDLVNYADFLRKHGRFMSKSGFVDSSRRIRSLQRQQDDLLTQHRTTPARTGLLAALNKAPYSASSIPAINTMERKSKTFVGSELPSVISISTNLDAKQKEHDKHMRLIEEQMIKAKQTERESKRLEGDVKKEQRHLHHTLKELDMDTSKKRFDAEKSLSKNLEEKDRIERDFMKKRDQLSKQRTEHLIDALQSNKDQERRNILACNDLARQYRTKADELELKHQQINRLHAEFEQKVQQKETEENRIKKELGEIAIALNLEATKAKRDMHQFSTVMHRDRTQTIKRDLEQEQNFEKRLNETSIHVKNYDLERRRLSADVSLNRSTLDLKQREAMRRIVDTKNRLETIYAEQRQLNQSAAVAEQDRRAAELMAKMADVESRRVQLMSDYLKEKVERNEERESEGATKAKVRYAENETREHEDHLRHFQKIASKNEEVEHDLRKTVKEAEFERRKKEQEIQRLQEELIRKKREDAIRIREEIARAEQEEKELEQHLIREKAQLDKLHARREDNYLRLLKQREQIRENKALLETHAREHERLLRVHARSQSIQTINTI